MQPFSLNSIKGTSKDLEWMAKAIIVRSAKARPKEATRR